VKRLFIILLMNAWGGLRRMPGLYTAAMVLMSALALVVTSNITAGASPDVAMSLSSQQNTKHSVSHHSSATSQAFAFLDTTPSTLRADKKGQPTDQQGKTKQTSDLPQGSSTASSTDNTSAATGSSSQNSTTTQPATPATITLASMEQACQQGQTYMTYSVPDATLSFQSPTTATGTVTWQWEVETVDSTNTPSSPVIMDRGWQSAPASTSQMQLTATDASQPLFSKVASANYAYRVRLDVTGPVNVTSEWVIIPQATSVCQQPAKTTTQAQ